MRRALVLAALVALAAAACGGGGSTSDRVTLQVSAASSLADVLPRIGEDFERAHPDIDVSFNFAASSALAQQILEGGEADVFVSADEPNMAKLTDERKASGPQVIARNRLAVIVEAGNPKRIGAVADLTKPGVVLVLCAPQVPCGRYATLAFQKAGVSPSSPSFEENVKAVVAKVELGEADAGIVYATDLRTAGPKVEAAPVPGFDDPALEARYPAAVVTESPHGSEARAWIAHLRSPAGQAALQGAGFLGA